MLFSRSPKRLFGRALETAAVIVTDSLGFKALESMPFMILEQGKGDHLFPSGIHQGTEGLPKTRRLKCIMPQKRHKTKQSKK
jgi:hypothetical protein